MNVDSADIQGLTMFQLKKLYEIIINRNEQNQDIDAVLKLIDEEIKRIANYAATVIQKSVRNKQTKRKSIDAATAIQQSVRNRQMVSKQNIFISQYLCRDLKNKEVYREHIRELIDLYSHKIDGNRVAKQLYMYYCKFGSKSLGYDNNATPRDPCINKFYACIFLNVSFKSTRLSNIDFDNVEFISARPNIVGEHDLYTKIMKRKFFTQVKHKKSEITQFNNTRITGSQFNKCKFYNITFKNLICGSSKYNNYAAVTKFNECKFYNVNFSDYFQSADIDIVIGKDISKFRTWKLNNRYKIEVYSPSIPMYLRFVKCIFNNVEFMKTSTELKYVDFDECVFNRCKFNHLIIDTCIFSQCKFNFVDFINCQINGSVLDKCIFTNVKFNILWSGQLKTTSYFGCEFIYTTFTQSQFRSYKYNLACTAFDQECKFIHSNFISCDLKNFIFNFNTRTEDNPKLLSMKKTEFICCQTQGTNFDYCDLEGSNFAARINCITYMSYLSQYYYIYKKNDFDNVFKLKTLYEGLYNSRDVTEKLSSLITIPELNIQPSNISYSEAVEIKYSRYLSLGIDINTLLNNNEIKAYDYIQTQSNVCVLIPGTSFKESNIVNCNFQSVDGLNRYDFSTVKKGSDGKPSLNSTNFTGVDLICANFSGCNLKGTIFQAADIKYANFENSETNENTDFEATLNIGLAINAEHINFGDLQNQANETHARSQFVITNIDTITDLLSSVTSNINIFITQPDDIVSNIFDKIVEIIEYITGENRIDPTKIKEYKNYLVKYLPILISSYICIKLNYDLHDFKIKLKKCITPEFIDILVSRQINHGNTWCWLELFYSSIGFLFASTKLYLHIFMQYYFNEVFNAHGENSQSCVLGMVERWVTIHSQTIETYVMTLDIDNPTDEQIKEIQKYSQNHVDTKITKEYIEKFNKPTPEDTDIIDKYTLYKFLNLLKPNANMPEKPEEDDGITIDFSITPKMREDWHREAAQKITNSEINSLQGLCDFFIDNMTDIIFKDNELEESETNINKYKPLIKKYLVELELPNLVLAIISMYGKQEDEILLEDLKDYFDVNATGKKKRYRKRKSTKKKSKSKNYNKKISGGSNKKSRTYAINYSSEPQKSPTYAKNYSSVPQNFKKLEKKVLLKFSKLTPLEVKQLYDHLYKVKLYSNVSNPEINIMLDKPNSLKRYNSASIPRSNSRSNSSSNSKIRRSASAILNTNKIPDIIDIRKPIISSFTLRDKNYRELLRKHMQKLNENDTFVMTPVSKSTKEQFIYEIKLPPINRRKISTQVQVIPLKTRDTRRRRLLTRRRSNKSLRRPTRQTRRSKK